MQSEVSGSLFSRVGLSRKALHLLYQLIVVDRSHLLL